MASFSCVKPLSAALWYLLASNRVVVWGKRRSELEKQCLLTTRVRLDCDLHLVWGQDSFWSNLNFNRVSSVSVLSVSGVGFSLKIQIALSFTGESCMELSPLFLRMSFITYRIYLGALLQALCLLKLIMQPVETELCLEKHIETWLFSHQQKNYQCQ
jgi:hypothetical protein